MTGVNMGGGLAMDLPSLFKFVDSDPEYRKKMEELLAAETAAKKAQADLVATQNTLTALRDETNAKIAQLNAAQAEHDKRVSEFSAQQTSQVAGFAARETAIKAQEAAIATKRTLSDADIAERTNAVAARESTLKIRERDVAVQKAALDRTSARLNAKMAKVAEAEAI